MSRIRSDWEAERDYWLAVGFFAGVAFAGFVAWVL